jgi:hypothetical protein
VCVCVCVCARARACVCVCVFDRNTSVMRKLSISEQSTTDMHNDSNGNKV